MQFTISQSTEKELDNFLFSNLEYFSLSFKEKYSNENYSHKLFENSVRYEAWDNNTLIGLLCVYINNDLRQAHIPYICVSKDLKNKGIGSRLIEMLCADLKETKNEVDFIDLYVYKSNHSAYKFYLKEKFIVFTEENNRFRLRKYLNK